MKNVNYSLLFFIAFSALGFDYDPRREGEYYVNYFKEKEVENHIKGSTLFNDCKDEAEKSMPDDDYKARNDQILTCVEDGLNNTDDKGIEALGKALDSPNYKLLSNKDNKQIREYLEDRFAASVYGNIDYKNDRSKQKIIGQDMYFKWYHSQLSKNFLSDVSGFCLENIRINKGNDFYFIEDGLRGIAQIPGGPNSAGFDWYELTKEDLKEDNKKGTQKEVNKHLSETFKDPNVGNYLKSSFATCLQAINVLCEKIEDKFKGSVTVDPNNTGITKLNLVNGAMPPAGTTGAAASTSNIVDGEGKRSCIISKRIRSYRTTLANYDAIYKEFEKIYKRDPDDPSFITFEDRFYGWGNKANEKGIDQLVNISSNEAKEALANKDAEAFKKIGCDKDITKEECKVFLHADDKTKEFHDITAQIEAQALLKQRQLDQLKKDPSEFEKYLKDNGYTNELEALKKGTNQEEILTLLRQKHIAEKKSLLKELKEQFEAKSLKKKDLSDPNMAIAAKQNVKENITEDLNQKDEKMKDMVRYANILSSFIGVTVTTPDPAADPAADPKKKTNNKSSKDKNLKATGTVTERNLIGLKVEVENQGENEQELFQYLGTPDGSSRANNSNSTLSTNEIDNILSSFFTRDAYKPAPSPNSATP
ncbi:hypothetical protein N9N67_05580 [Bacteriovoracaceae bacterium]|nr:hypothetical protein [Bacteriovoracaceae bacterium]